MYTTPDYVTASLLAPISLGCMISVEYQHMEKDLERNTGETNYF